jgi:D-alanine-D-alanine ligase
MRIAVLENLKQNAPHTPNDPIDACAEFGAPELVQGIVEALERSGHEAAFFEGDLSLLELLPKFDPDLCFNMCEGHFGEGRECHVPALLEMLGIPYTGSGIPALALTLDKPMTQALLAARGLPVPPYQLFDSPDLTLDPALDFPLFVKPSREGTSKGITEKSVVRSEGELREQVAWVLSTYAQPAMVERFISGREISVGVLGNCGGAAELIALPPYEVLLGGGADGVFTYDVKSKILEGRWEAGREWSCPAPLEEELGRQLARIAKEAFAFTGCRDVARVDFRLDVERGLSPYVLEVNALPGLFLNLSSIVFEALAAGMTYDAFILSIVEHAASRLGLVHAPGAAVT